jgi:hypothetical protein
MARKKTPPEYGESDCLVVSGVSRGTEGPCHGGDRHRVGRKSEIILTGPMMVACQ